MVTVMITHVYQLFAFGDERKGGIHHGIGSAHKRDHGAVGGGTRVHIQQCDALGLTDYVGHLVDDVLIFAFTKVRNTFD